MNDIPFQELQSVSFGICKPEDIEKISVIEIYNPLTFNDLEHPEPGGLYDPHLGPNNQDELCATCGLRVMQCPGHAGHIKLPLPVFHPVFIKTLYQILQGSCFKCHRLVASSNAVQVALYQFQVLDHGLVGTVEQLAEAISDPALISANKNSTVEATFLLQEKLKSIVNEVTKVLDHSSSNPEKRTIRASVKSVIECRQRLIKEFLKTHFTNARQKCPHCDAKKPKIALRHNAQFLSNVGGKPDLIKVTSKGSMKTVLKTKDAGMEDVVNVSENFLPEEDIISNISITPADAKKHLDILWEKEKVFLRHLFGILRTESISSDCPINAFFIEHLMVSPSRFRPLSLVRGRKYLNPQSTALRNVLSCSLLLKNIMKVRNGDMLPDADMDTLQKLPGKTDQEKVINLWQQLQTHVNCVYDSELDKLSKEKTFIGVKQVLEKKEGLFRKHMMGKRVNFAARSVISPDPHIMVDEIGVPIIFAKKLTYATPVTDWNVEKLRRAVINGPDIHPGADKIEMEDGRVIKLNANRLQRQAYACQLLTPSTSATGMYCAFPKKVHRHLENGDVVLLNRQPTLHKPSIMAHRVRVLPGERTLRLHYANCKSYNADFDGDEMNAHFPQNEIARSEGYNIVSVNHQYLVPKDGTPLSGLIQDHIIAGTLLTIRGRFFDRNEYQQLVYGAIAFTEKPVKLLPPIMLKPQVLWSGKQIVSTIIINIIPEGSPPPTVQGKAKVEAKYWQNSPSREWTVGGPLDNNDMSESEVIIQSGELLCGVIDKGHIGPTPYGLVHCCYELYGGKTSSALLTALARVFTHFLQILKGFTLGYEDILLTNEATKNRRNSMRQARRVGDQVVTKALDVGDSGDKLQIMRKFQQAHLSKDDTGLKTLDFEMKAATNNFNDDINKICTRGGLLKNFPSNNLQLMVQSGAKGALVNSTQISGALGQIELEGRRVPLTINGSTLTSFLPYDTSPRAGGFVDGRFLTGIRSQEYFFHCMAGREGLIDTAVKTSRSGYLQRCLIKHLEGLVVNYDMTVRDSDGSIIQFLYGEDGLDISKMQMLKEGKVHLLAQNYSTVIDEEQVENLKTHTEHSVLPNSLTFECPKNKCLEKRRSLLFPAVPKLKSVDDLETRTVYQNKVYSALRSRSHPQHEVKERYTRFARVDPVNSLFRPDLTFGAISEKLDSLIADYIQKNYLEKSQGKKRAKRAAATRILDMYYYKAMKSLVQPGEAVGLLAAQSIGEPSTQMTLNTFHFAGRGEMNVTLGIPRLREILMVASAAIATPTMDLPLLNKPKVEKEAEKLRTKLSSVSLIQVVQNIEVSEVKHVKSRYRRFRRYTVRMTFCPPTVYKKKLHTSPSEILKYVERKFILSVISAMKKKLASVSAAKLLSSSSSKTKGPFGTSVFNPETEQEQPTVMEVDDGASSDEGANDDDTVATKARSRHNQELEYEEPESDENPDDPAFDGQMEDDGLTIKTEIDSGAETDVNESLMDYNSKMATNSGQTRIEEQVENVQKKARIESILKNYQWVQHYDYDSENELWCEFTLQLYLDGSKIDIKTLLEDEANNAVLYCVPNIKRAFLVKNPNSKNGEQMLKTDGVNFLEIFKCANIIDTSKIYSNDIHAIAKIYGIEAAAKAIVKEIKNVFATYHIEVDSRHLLLIADYMTFDGTFRACNRIGMESNASPIQQMTFETTMSFLQTATLTGSEDFLKSPSARLVVGQNVGVGTGCFDVLMKFDEEASADVYTE